MRSFFLLVIISQAPMSIIYKHNFIDLALIVTFSVSTAIMTEY